MVSVIIHCWFSITEELNVPGRYVCAVARGEFFWECVFFCLLFHNLLHENPTC